MADITLGRPAGREGRGLGGIRLDSVREKYLERKHLIAYAVPVLLLTCTWLKLVLASRSLALGPIPTHTAVSSATLAALLLLSAPALWLLSRRRLAVLLLLNGLLSTMVVADAMHFRFFGDVISIEELLHARQLIAVSRSVVASGRVTDVLYFADILVVLLWAMWRRLKVLDPPPSLRTSGWLVLSALVFGSTAAVPSLRLIALDPEEVFGYSTTRREVVGAIGLLPYHAYDLAIYLRYPLLGRMTVGSQDIAGVRAFLQRNRQPSQSPFFGISRGSNLIMVMVESLQAFPIGLRVHGQAVTPNLSAFASQSLNFDNFYDDTYLGTTSDGTFTTMQSLHPLPAGAVATRFHSNTFWGLPAILSSHGYSTLSACPEPGYFWNKLQMHPKLGFQKSYFLEALGPGEELGLGLADRDFFSKMVPVLTGQKEPFAALLTTLSSHHPYRIPQSHRFLQLGTLEDTSLGDYLQSIHYVDRAFGEFVQQLRVRGVLDRSVVAVFGDHHAWLEHSSEWEETLGLPVEDEYGYWRASKRLPLMIRLPDGQGASQQQTTGGHVDIAPTLLSLLGIEARDRVMLGQDLTERRRGLAVFRDGSITDGQHDLIDNLGGSGMRCYEVSGRKPVGCAVLDGERAIAEERLSVSDLILRGNLIPQLRQSLGPRVESLDVEHPKPAEP